MKKHAEKFFYGTVIILGLAITIACYKTEGMFGTVFAMIQGFIGGFILMAGVARMVIAFRKNK